MLCNNYKSNTPIEKIGRDGFEKLTKTEKVGYLFNSGEELLCREDPEFTISLYILNNFFVEIWYSAPSRIIERIELTTNEEVLENYDHEIDLTDLF